MTDQTQALKPGEIIHNGERKLATCATCVYQCDFGYCMNSSMSGFMPNLPDKYFCDKHPLRDPQVRIAEALERIAENIISTAEFLVNEGTDSLAKKLDLQK